MVGARNLVILLLQRIDGIVHGEALARILVILVDDGLTGELAHTHDTVGPVHTVLLDGVDGGVHLAAAAVEVGGMHVDAHRFAAHLLGVDAGGIGEPVVGVDDVEVEGACHLSCDDGVVVDFLVQVAGIAASELHGTQVVDVHVVEVGIDMFAQPIVHLWRHDVADALFHIVVVHITVGDGHCIHGHDGSGAGILIAERFGQTEDGFDIALGVEALADAEVGGGKTTKHMRRILPSKH